MLSVDVSPTRPHLVSGCGTPENRVLLWDIRNGRQSREFAGHARSIHVVKYSPDGQYVASAGKGEAVILCDAMTLEEVCRYQRPVGYVECLAFSPDSRYLAAGTSTWNEKQPEPPRVQVWEVETGREAWSAELPLKREARGVEGIAFTPDGERLVIAEEDFRDGITVWEAATGEMVRRFGGPPAGGPGYSSVRSLDVAPDGRWIATGHAAIAVDSDKWDDPENAVIRLWDPEAGREVRKLVGHKAGIDCVDFSPDGRLLVSGSGGQYLNDKIYEKAAADNSIRVWDVSTGRQLVRQNLPKAVKCVTFSPDGRHIASSAGAVGDTPDLQLWRLPEQVWKVPTTSNP